MTSEPMSSSYTIVNLKQLEDSAAGRATGVEARFARTHLDSAHLGVTYLRYQPDVRSQIAHSHREQEEAYVVVSGSGRVLLDEEERDLRQWDVVRCSPQTVRAFAAGPEGLELIAIGSDRPEGGDGLQTDANWDD
jgi:mannose-6-phosphate isomerase-like protein (cupin superfamily)